MISVAPLDEPRLLFSNQNSLDHTRALLETAIRDVDGIHADELLNTPTEDIVAELVEKHSFTPPTLRRDEAYIDGPHEMKLIRSDHGRTIVLPATLVGLIVPFDGEPSLFYLNPNRWGGTIYGNLHHQNL